MDDKYFTIFSLIKDDLDLDDKENVLKSGDPILAKYYSVIALLEMSAKAVGKGAKSGDELRENLNNALSDGYRDTDEMKKELDNALEILRKTIADNTIILSKYTSNYEIAIRALTESNETKDKIIEDRDETIRRLKRDKLEKSVLTEEPPEDSKHTLTGKSEKPEVPEDNTAEKSSAVRAALKSFMRSKGNVGKENDKVDPAKEQAEPSEERNSEKGSDLSTFIDNYINNEEYSDEARSYLLDCYQNGTPLDVISQFARPQFSVKILKRLKKIYERRQT